MMADGSFLVAKTLSRATGSIFYRLLQGLYNYCWLISVDWLTLGGQSKKNKWFIYCQMGLRSTHWNACVTSGWLVIFLVAHWCTMRCIMRNINHVIDLMVTYGPIEAFIKPLPVLLTLPGAL